MVLLADVGHDQVDEPLGRASQIAARRLVSTPSTLQGHCHGAHQRPALLVLGEHHGDRTGVSRHALGFELRKQQILLLAVMTGVRKQPEERDAAGHGVVVERFSVSLGGEPRSERGGDLENEPVLVPEQRRRRGILVGHCAAR